MKWKPGKRSGDIEDRRGAGGGFGAGGGMPIPMGRLGRRRDRDADRPGHRLFPLHPGRGWRRRFQRPRPDQLLPTGAAERHGERLGPREPERGEGGPVRRLRPGGRAGLLDAAVPGGRQALPAREGGALQQPGAIRLRARQLRDRAVLLPARPEGLPRPRLLQRAQSAVQGPRRLRPGLRDRPRARAPRPAGARHRAEGSPAEPGEPGRRERAVGAARAAGRLPRRRLGALDLRPRHPRERRPPGGTDRGRGGRATIASSSRPREGSIPSPSPTAPRSSATTGSRPASTRAGSRPATPSQAISSAQLQGRDGSWDTWSGHAVSVLWERES